MNGLDRMQLIIKFCQNNKDMHTMIIVCSLMFESWGIYNIKYCPMNEILLGHSQLRALSPK